MGVVGGIAINTAHELGHKRASSERWLSRVALAQTGYGHFFIEHNRGHHVRVATPGGPGQLAAGGELLGVPAAHRARQRHLGLGHRARPPRPHGQVALDAAQRHPRRLGDDRRPLRRAGDRLRPGRPALPADPGGARLLAAGGRQLPRALRPAAPEERGRPLRALPPGAQLEQQQRRLQRPPLPPAAPLRPPRQPDPPLPGAAPLQGGAAAAHRLRRDDRPRLVPAALAPGDGPAPGRALRRRGRARPTSSRASASRSSPATEAAA